MKSASLDDEGRKSAEAQLKTVEDILKTDREMQDETKGIEEEVRLAMRDMARNIVNTWKINKALYEKYGGRVIFQQMGVEPVDAYRDFLREQEKNGAFKIIDKKYEAGFWRYYTNDAMHTFYPDDEGRKFINTPWWMMEEKNKSMK